MTAHKAAMNVDRRALRICTKCLFAMALLATLVVASFAYLSLGLERLFTIDSARELVGFLLSFFPPDV